MKQQFTGKSVLVTGAAAGIGKAAVELFADQGARVLAVDLDIDDASGANATGSVVHFAGDAGDEQDVATMVETAVKLHGRIDIVCANAGISGGMAGLFEQSLSDWEQLLKVNLIGPFLLIKHSAKAMLDAARPGAIVCTSSIAGLRAGAGGLAYSASKAGVVNLVQGAAQQLAGSGIRVNAVCPGLIETGMTSDLYANARSKGREDAIGKLNPLKRGGQPVEIARAIAFLASAEAAYINGHALVVDGGLSTSHPFSKPRKLGQASF